ncbi:MAG: hypothetical protein LBK74_00535 [Treponema sp.]|nr:hypothetical protein [Treponema sp.]
MKDSIEICRSKPNRLGSKPGSQGFPGIADFSVTPIVVKKRIIPKPLGQVNLPPKVTVIPGFALIFGSLKMFRSGHQIKRLILGKTYPGLKG